MAGKIRRNCWRNSLVPTDHNRIPHPEDGKPFISRATLGGHNYCGPWFISCDHGCAHGSNLHGMDINGCTEGTDSSKVLARPHLSSDGYYSEYSKSRDSAFLNAISGIVFADLIFAWIDSPDCYGTLAEIGMAYGLGKTIAIGFALPMEDLWFVEKMRTETDITVGTVFKDAKEAFNTLVLKKSFQQSN